MDSFPLLSMFFIDIPSFKNYEFKISGSEKWCVVFIVRFTKHENVHQSQFSVCFFFSFCEQWQEKELRVVVELHSLLKSQDQG